jgi:Xaa-Pro aminopeptidase
MNTERISTERVATRVSDAEMQRRWNAVRTLMRERGIQALIAYHTEDWLGGHARWFTDIPTHNGYGRTVMFHADDLMTVIDQGSFGSRSEFGGKDPYHRGVGEIIGTSFFSSVHYTTAYQGEIVREIVKKRGYKTIGFVVPGTMPHKLVHSIVDGFDGLTVIDVTEQIDRLIAIKSAEELDLMRRCAAMQDAIFRKVIGEIKPGMRDVDVTAMAWREGWVQGSSQGIYLGASSPIGKPSFLLGRHFQDRPLQKDDNLSFLIEVNGPGGYFTEVGRTIVLGKASAQLQDKFAAAKAAQDYSASLLKPGVPCRDIAKAHDEFMKFKGLPPELRLYSHGQGYDMVERPLVRFDEPMTIEAGMCLAVHPAFALPDMFVIICDNYIVGPKGAERIHKTARKVFEV